MNRCSRCVLPETFPRISFDEQGVCNYCRAYKGHEHLKKEKLRYRQKFEALVGGDRKANDYDCIMAYSGGKDSSFTLYVMKKQYHMNILACTFDNGFISPVALDNMSRVLDALRIDHLIVRPPFTLLKKLFNESIKKEIYSLKSLERASAICTTCMGLVKFIIIKLAVEKKIPLIIYGWSPGQAPLSSSVFRNTPGMLAEMQSAFRQSLDKIVGHDIDPYFLRDEQLSSAHDLPYNISPLIFLNYDEREIVQTIEKMGWQFPGDTDANSTNCLLNSYANRIHKKKYQFHPYDFEMGNLVREGYLSRTEALAKLEAEEDAQTIHNVEKKLNE